ncbi:MAG: hypothetical protein E7307_08035 [Butyrivibrio sp.]|nr:hypothetical protein [Butyrivibrio sp.]
MDFKYKVTEKNVSTYNPMEYTRDQMQFTNIKEEDANARPQDLYERGQTLQSKLLGMGMETVNPEEMQQPVSFEDRVKATKDFARIQAATMAKTTGIFRNSNEMNTVIKMVNGLNALLEGDVPRLNGMVDANALKQTHLKGFDAAINACQYYLDTKTPKYNWTKKRYRRVEAMKLALEKERELLSVVVSQIADMKFKPEELANIKSTRDLLDKANSHQVIGEAELQIEGNSTDVYRIRLNINGKDGYYYFKQNLKPVGDDLKGFVNRRLGQLAHSKEHSGDARREEARLHGKIDMKDYEFGEEFLTQMKTKLDSASDNIKDSKELNKRYLSFLGHDFDKVFSDLAVYNTKAEESKRTLITMKADLEKAKAENNQLRQKALEANIKEHKVFEKMTEYQWIEQMAKSKKNPLGLSLSKDKELFAVLKRMSLEADPKEQNGGNSRISRFFTMTLGKEIEAYGQQKDRSNASDDEVMAKNNTATYRIANLFGFNDVITSSESAVLNIKLAGKEHSEDVSGTISVEAPGLEMLKLVEIAEKNGKKIHYSPKALRQMVRLQMIDTTFLQTDRHWRNFKCKTKPDLTNYDENKPLNQDIVIESIGSYDHDMSFGVMNLKDAFKQKDNPDGASIKNGMLPPILRKISRTSPEAVYFNARLMGGANLKLFENMKVPTPRIGTGYYDVHERNRRIGYYQSKVIKLKELGVESAEELPKKQIAGSMETFYEYNGMILKKNDRYSMYICDEKGEKIGYNILDKYLFTETQLGVKFISTKISDTEKMLETSKMLNGEPITANLKKSILDRCGAIGNHIKFDDNGMTNLKDLKKEDRVNVLAEAMLLHADLSQIDVSDNEAEKKESTGTGYIEHKIRTVIYNFKLQLDAMKEKDRTALLAEVKKKVIEKLNAKKVADQQNEENKKSEEAEYMEVPTMLHMDRQAYLDICEMQNHFEDTVKLALHDLGWQEDKIMALKERIVQQKEEIEKCQIMAERILEQMYPEGSKLRSFFLDSDDYAQIKDIKEIAWDPGMSYFATEDENFLMSDENFNEFLSQDERQTRLENTNEHRKIKRMHGLKQNLTSYSTMISGSVKA